MRICFFGTYTLAEGYPVNRVVLRALKAAGAQVVECHADLWRRPRQRWSGRNWFLSPFFWVRAATSYLKLIFNYWQVGPYDLMVVGYLGQQDIFLARILNWFRGRPLVLIAFNSLYETVVVDRGMYGPGSLAGRFLWWLDRTSCRMADVIILDTRAHIDYFVHEFHLPQSLFLRVFVSSDLPVETAVPASPPLQPGFEVLFVGTYIPLHGMETILKAAEILRGQPDIRFTLVGQGQLYPLIRESAERRGLNQITFVTDWIPGSQLALRIRQADACLGIFGAGEKAGRVIPCKVFDSLAMGKPLITADSPAAREILRHEENALLVPPGDAEGLAREIRRLKEDLALRQGIARKAYEAYRSACSPETVGKNILDHFQTLCENRSSP